MGRSDHWVFYNRVDWPRRLARLRDGECDSITSVKARRYAHDLSVRLARENPDLDVSLADAPDGRFYMASVLVRRLEARGA
jgi:hypothetical protein